MALIQLDTRGYEVVFRGQEGVMPLGLDNGYFYYSDLNSPAVYAKELTSGKVNKIVLPAMYDVSNFADSVVRRNQDNSISIINDRTPNTRAICITEDTATEESFHPQEFSISNTVYFADNTRQPRTVYKIDSQGKQECVLEVASCRRIDLFPLFNGLLVYAADSNTPLFWIDETGSLTEMFSFQSTFTETAMNYLGNDIYLSFARYEKIGETFGALESYPNDKIEGTYVVHLEDLSVEKLSDQVFGGIYVFDDGLIYACTKSGNVYQFTQGWDKTLTILDNVKD